MSFFNFDGEYGGQYEGLIRGIFPSYDQLYATMNRLLQARLLDQSRLLVVGAGGGMELLTFGRANPQWRFVGVDPSEQMLAFARHKAEVAGLSERVQLVLGQAGDVPEEEPFDAASCVLVLHFVPDDGGKLALLQEVARRLKPGAPFVLVSITADPEKEPFGLYLEALARTIEGNGMSRMKAEVILHNAISEMHLVPTERVDALLTEAGFRERYRFFSELFFEAWVAFA